MRLFAPPFLKYLFDGAARHAFTISDEASMKRLGTDFADAVLISRNSERSKPNHPDAVLRVGLASDGRVKLGKSVFANGMLENFKACRQLDGVESRTLQGVWHSPLAGTIRLYDCGYAAQSALPSYIFNKTAEYPLPLTDIVEHPYEDMHNRHFDYLVFIHQAGGNARTVTFAAMPERMNAPEMQEFLKKMKATAPRAAEPT